MIISLEMEWKRKWLFSFTLLCNVFCSRGCVVQTGSPIYTWVLSDANRYGQGMHPHWLEPSVRCLSSVPQRQACKPLPQHSSDIVRGVVVTLSHRPLTPSCHWTHLPFFNLAELLARLSSSESIPHLLSTLCLLPLKLKSYILAPQLPFHLLNETFCFILLENVSLNSETLSSISNLNLASYRYDLHLCKYTHLKYI